MKTHGKVAESTGPDFLASPEMDLEAVAYGRATGDVHPLKRADTVV